MGKKLSLWFYGIALILNDFPQKPQMNEYDFFGNTYHILLVHNANDTGCKDDGNSEVSDRNPMETMDFIAEAAISAMEGMIGESADEADGFASSRDGAIHSIDKINPHICIHWTLSIYL